MQENPYKPLDIPEEDDVLLEKGSPEELRELAKRQRHLLFALLFSILFTFANLGLGGLMQSTPADQIPAGTQFAAVGIFVGILSCLIWRFVATFRLAVMLYSTGVAILWTIGNILPLIGFILLLILNQKAISRLQQHGLKVGFMGVNPSQVKLTPVTADDQG